MKNLMIVSRESLFAGQSQSGVAEVVDSLAVSLSGRYNITVVAPRGKENAFARMGGGWKPIADGIVGFRLMKVTYRLLESERFGELLAQVSTERPPDVLHNFAEPELLSVFPERPARCVYTIDHVEAVAGKEEALAGYDAVTTVSEAYAKSILRQRSATANTLAGMDFRGITNGIASGVLNPSAGLMLPAKYGPLRQDGKAECKRALLRHYGITGEPIVFLMMARLAQEKGVDAVIAAAHTIRDAGGVTIIVGRGAEEYEAQLRTLTLAEDGVLWRDVWPHVLQALPVLAGADFYLSPSTDEPCGLMPMTACRYGAIPIATLAGGLADNMDEEIAVIVGADGLDAAVLRAVEIYRDRAALRNMRRRAMLRDFSWATRKAGYVDVYEEVSE